MADVTSAALRAGSIVATLASATSPAPATPSGGQEDGSDASAVQSPPADAEQVRDIVVTGRRIRGSAIGADEPVAVLDQAGLAGLGATNIRTLLDRLKPLTTTVDGEAPAVLLNGRRVSSIDEVEGLPPEAIERTEILREDDAARFGFPPTVRVLNFITKERFKASTLQQLAGATTEGGGGTEFLEATSARIEGPRRLSLSVSYFRQNPVLQSQRAIVPDPGTLYAVPGNVTGVGDATLDPQLDQAVGAPVSVAAVPDDPARRPFLASYVAGADRPLVTDIGAYRSLQQRNDTVRMNGVYGTPIGRSIDASLSLGVDSTRSTGSNGLASGLLTVPGGGGYLPFERDVLLYRYFPGAVLRQTSGSVNLRGGATLQGGIGSWVWNATAAYARDRSRADTDQGFDIAPLQALVDAGGDPFATPAGTARTLLTDRDRSLTRIVTGRAFASGPFLHLPAGPIRVTVAADGMRSDSNLGRRSSTGDGDDLVRTVSTGSVSAIVPIASPERHVLKALGRLSANATVGVSAVSGFGSLTRTNFGLDWSPDRAVQLIASINRKQTAPDITLLTSPILVTPNVPFFDYTSGRSVLVSTVLGGDAGLAPERRRDTRIGIVLKPYSKKDIGLNLDYIDTKIRDQVITPGSTTSAFQIAFPDRFARNGDGILSLVDLRAVNIDRERERKVQLTITGSLQFGRADAVDPAADGERTTTGAPPKVRPSVSAFIVTTYRLQDDIVLRPGGDRLNLLDGATITGSGGRPRWQVEGSLSGTIGAASVGSIVSIQGSSRVRSDLPSADLRFSGRTWLVPYVSLDAGRIANRPWTHGMSIQFTIENLLNDRVDVRDRGGRTPNRFQSAYLDPIGRSVRLGVRKRF